MRNLSGRKLRGAERERVEAQKAEVQEQVEENLSDSKRNSSHQADAERGEVLQTQPMKTTYPCGAEAVEET